MHAFLIYELKVAVALAVFSLFYRLLLSKETFHRFNRVILLLTSALSFVLPFCVVVFHETIAVTGVQGTDSAAVTINQIASVHPAFNWEILMSSVFFAGTLVILLRIAYSVIKILKLTKNGKRLPQSDGSVLVIVDDNKNSPFSWMKYIVVSEEDYSSANEGILIHEKAHVALGHSWDILFMDLIIALQWFNPASWILKSDLRSIHEYEADEAVINAGTDMRDYQLLLVKKAVATVWYPAANNLTHSTLKKRITMMLCKKSSMFAALKALYVLPLIGISIAVNAETRYEYVSDDVSAETAVASERPQEEAVPYQLVEIKPQFNGGNAREFVHWVNDNLVYPADAKKDRIQGRVTLSVIIDKEGNVGDVKVLRSVSPSLDAEAVRVVSMSPQWTPAYDNGAPVNVQMTFPVVFALKDTADSSTDKQ